MTDETVWLIERADPLHPGAPLPNSFLGIDGTFDGFYGSGKLRWMDSAHDAIRFARRKDGALFVGMMALIQEDLLHRDTLAGLRSGDPRALVIEHCWSEPAQGDVQGDALREALQKIADLVDREEGEPLDDAIRIANVALAETKPAQAAWVIQARQFVESLQGLKNLSFILVGRGDGGGGSTPFDPTVLYAIQNEAEPPVAQTDEVAAARRLARYISHGTLFLRHPDPPRPSTELKDSDKQVIVAALRAYAIPHEEAGQETTPAQAAWVCPKCGSRGTTDGTSSTLRTKPVQGDAE